MDAKNETSTALYGWRYRLQSAHALNAAAGAPSAVEGFLLRTLDGYGCVQPWPQFGHGTADEVWAILAAGGSTELTNQAIECCRCDGAARRNGVSWWSGLTVPESHATLSHVSQASAAYEAGFRLWKVKCGPRDLAAIGELMAEYPDIGWRIDCNETADPACLEPWVREHAAVIDFIEDPYPHEKMEDWQRLATNVRLAMDRVWRADCSFLPVWKPAWNDMMLGMIKKQTIVTSAMDHPVGQAWAAYQSAGIGTSMTCGLRTDHLFETNVFSELFTKWSSAWTAISGCGMGWNDELEGLPWIRIRS
jgi:O-succinylbenzoate synthase